MSSPVCIRLSQGEFVEGFAADAVIHASETSAGRLSAAFVKDDEFRAPFTHELGLCIHLDNGRMGLMWEILMLRGEPREYGTKRVGNGRTLTFEQK
jgi:hypothetical protein